MTDSTDLLNDMCTSCPDRPTNTVQDEPVHQCHFATFARAIFIDLGRMRSSLLNDVNSKLQHVRSVLERGSR